MGQNSVQKSVLTRTAGEALTANYMVIPDPSNEKYVLHPTADNMDCCGRVDDRGGAASGSLVAIHTEGGYCWLVASGSVTDGDWLIVVNGGKVKTDPKTSTTTSKVVGKALEDAVDGALFKAELKIFDRYNA